MNLRVYTMLCIILTAGGITQTALAGVVFTELPEAVQPLAELEPEPAPAVQPAAAAPQSAAAAPQQQPAVRKTKRKARRYWAMAWVNQADNTYTFGESVTFYAKAKRAVYITLLDVGTSGQVHVIFPNKHQPDNFVRAGQTVRIPGPRDDFTIEARPPAGVELIKLIATEAPHAFFDPEQTEDSERFVTLLQDTRTLAANLKKLLNQRHHGRWNEYAKVIRITPPG